MKAEARIENQNLPAPQLDREEAVLHEQLALHRLKRRLQRERSARPRRILAMLALPLRLVAAAFRKAELVREQAPDKPAQPEYEWLQFKRGRFWI